YASTVGEVRIHDRETGAAVCPPLPVVGGAWGLLFSPDSRRLIVTTSRGQVSIWSIPEGKLVAGRVVFPPVVHRGDLAPDGKRFATGSTDFLVRQWDATTGRVLHEMRHGSEINSLAYSPDGRLLAVAGEDRVVRLWNTADGSLLRELIGHQNEVMS